MRSVTTECKSITARPTFLGSATLLAVMVAVFPGSIEDGAV